MGVHCGQIANLVWSVARSFQLGQSDASDVSQATWLRLVEHIDDVRDADKLGSWLATTARREALALLRRAGRDCRPATDFVGTSPDARREDDGARRCRLRDERDAALWQAFARRCPSLASSCCGCSIADPPPSYAEVSAALDMPVGSIGPTRQRCLGTLRRRLGST